MLSAPGRHVMLLERSRSSRIGRCYIVYKVTAFVFLSLFFFFFGGGYAKLFFQGLVQVSKCIFAKSHCSGVSNFFYAIASGAQDFFLAEGSTRRATLRPERTVEGHVAAHVSATTRCISSSIEREE